MGAAVLWGPSADVFGCGGEESHLLKYIVRRPALLRGGGCRGSLLPFGTLGG